MSADTSDADNAKTLLLVDDEEAILSLARLALEQKGYQVLTAQSGPEALNLSEGHDDPIDLLLVDVVMPGMNGPEVAERLLASRPGLRVIFTSGYGDAAGVALSRRKTKLVYLKKPFGPSELVQSVHEVLQGPAEESE